MLEKTGQTRERENGSTQRDVVTGWTRKILRQVVLAMAPREGERAPVRTAPRNGIPGNRGAGAGGGGEARAERLRGGRGSARGLLQGATPSFFARKRSAFSGPLAPHLSHGPLWELL